MGAKRRDGRWATAALVALLLGAGGKLLAQDQPLASAIAERGPRFFLAARSEMVLLDVSRTSVLRRRVTIEAERVPLRTVLGSIASQAGLQLMFSPDVVLLESLVTLKATGITIGAALTEVLMDATVDVVLSPSGQMTIVRKLKGKGAAARVGVVTGRVTDSATKEGIPGVTVSSAGTRTSAQTDVEGRYTLRGVAAGAQTVTARKLGYSTRSRTVTVVDDGTATADFVLVRAPTTLNEIVVTPTGEQRRLELGHVVSLINADSLVKEAPISSLSELLTARVAGLQTFQTQGSVGGRVNLLMRGPNSFSVSNEPIFVVDGVRYTTDERRILRCCGNPGSTEPASPINDLNPNDIESIEVVKGPSAATLYGTNAANGVVVITTKRGRAGPATWNSYVRGTTTDVQKDNLPDIYWGWGTVNGVPSNPNLSCTLARLSSGECTKQDSATIVRNALKDPQYSILAPKPTLEYGVNVSGGVQDIKYYLSAEYKDATGPFRMPPGFVAALKQQLGLSELPRAWREPNTLANLNLRSNLLVNLGPKLSLRLSTGYIHSATNALTLNGDVYLLGLARTTPGDPTHPYASFGRSPDEAYLQQSSDNVDRFLGSAGGEWRPLEWLSTRATLGLDILGSQKYALTRPGDKPSNRFSNRGEIEDTRTRQTSTTADVGATTVFHRSAMSWRTTVGGQFTRTLLNVSGAFGFGLAPGQAVVSGATFVSSDASYRETAVLGGYAEEMLGFNERLFLTGAARMDGASAFGRDFTAATYPKAGVSWLLSAEPFMPRIPALDELRLRAALGASGNQPDPAWSRPGFRISRMVLNGQTAQTFRLFTVGNPNLRPERTREHEFGLDATAFNSRLRSEFTWFGRRTTDQIVNVSLPSDFGNIYDNLGLTTQSGFEAKVDGRVLDNRSLSFDIGIQHSEFNTLLNNIGNAPSVRSPFGGYVQGYPIGARFDQPVIGWTDADNNGIIEFNELKRTDTAVYLGQSFPPRTQSLSAVLGVLNGRLRVSTLIERKSGFTNMDPFQCGAQAGRSTCRELVDKNTPLDVQATMFLASLPQSADFTRLREITMALDLPARVNTLAHVNRSTIVLTGRNLALWSKFSGPDPEVSDPNLPGSSGSYGISRGGWAGGVPLGRALSLRVDVGF